MTATATPLEVRATSGFNAAVMRCMADIEQSAPVADWTLDGIHVWPLIRIELYFNLVFSHLRAPGVSGGSRVGRIVKQAEPLTALLRGAAASSRDRAGNDDASQRADVVFLANTVDRTNIDGVWHDKVSGPLRTRYERDGYRCLMLERTPTRQYRVPRADRSLLVQPRLDGQTMRARMARTPGDGIRWERFSEADRIVRQLNPKAGLTSPSTVGSWTSRIQRHARYFERVLRGNGARVGFVSNYFDLPGMAFILACRRIGIPSVELQHAAGNDMNPTYAAWTAIPRNGYELLPSVFWTWTRADAAVIEEWSSRTPHHDAIAGGNLWAAAWRDDAAELPMRYDTRIAAIKQRHAGSLDVLVALQETLYDAEAIRPVLRAVAQTQREWRWWLRGHPTAIDSRARVAEWLRAESIDRVIVDEATAFPLQAILRHVDVHVTHSSATTIEAEQIGVPSVLVSDYGEELYARQLESGVAVGARTPAEIIGAVSAQARRTKSRTDAVVADADVSRVLRQMLVRS